MIGVEHRAYLASALSRLLGAPTEGSVAYLTCLTSDQVDALADAEDFVVPGWSVAAVVDTAGVRRITADQAVEQREDKSNAIVFLVDRNRAGAGLDGIYSAGREIRESELFGEAQRLARRPLWGATRFLDGAVRRAERLGRRRLTPWGRFDFYVAAANEGEGRSLARIGLWPISRAGTPTDVELDLSAALADRLLYARDTRSIGERVRALLLQDTVQAVALEEALRAIVGRSPEDAAAAIVEQSEFWIGPLEPGFSSQSLRAIRLLTWRDAKGGVLRWSGLTPPEASGLTPRLLLDREAPSKERSRLTVRWTTEPDAMASGAVDYRVVVMAGEDELTELTISHRDKPQQQAVFAAEDFEELEGGEKFEAVVCVSVLGNDDIPAQISEAFTLEFGSVPNHLSAASGQIVRAISEGAISLPTRALFDESTAPAATARATEDRKGFITWKGETGGRGVRVSRPVLIRSVEEDWAARGGTVGRWIQTVRADGSPASALEFIPINVAVGDRLIDACRRLAAELGPTGLLGRVFAAKWPAADGYLNLWEKALELGDPELALHGSVEVRSQSGRTIGLIVTPLNPVRFAWHALYDAVLVQARYEGGMSSPGAVKAASAIDGAHFPFALPGTGLGVRGFAFADVLGFHAVAMTVDGESEPKSAVSILSACLGGGTGVAAPTVGIGSAAALAREVRHYLDCQTSPGGRPELINVQAWRAGDGLTVARALGQALEADCAAKVSSEDEATSPLCFTLDLYHPADSTTSGQFLAAVGRRRRSGGQVLEAADRWMTETAPRPGDVMVPRLRWSRRPEPASDADWTYVRATHLGLAFDLFNARLETRPTSELTDARPLHAYGLIRALERRVELGEEPEWTTWIPTELNGESAPENRGASDRLRRIDRAAARATARSLGGGAGDWPVLVTRLPAEHRDRLDRLHSRSDWVVTIDRNAGLEYFDSPRERPDVFERFVIDAVPERSDLASVQLVTSTTNLGAIRDLVDEALGDMGLSSSERNSRFLVGHLKALSGRLAIRLANGGTRTGELIALALVQANCAAVAPGDAAWLDLTNGVLVPVDEIADFAPTAGSADEGSGRRADFVHVSASPRGPLEFRFVEVKNRLHLRTARQPELLAHIAAQTGNLRRRWNEWFFGDRHAPMERAIRRSQLARLLRFYVERAARHCLSEPGRRRLLAEIDQLLVKEAYRPGEVDHADIGYIFCPEHRTGFAEPLYDESAGNVRLWLFGPTLLPDFSTSPPSPPETPPVLIPDEVDASTTPTMVVRPSSTVTEVPTSADVEATPAVDHVDVRLGQTPTGTLVEWRVSIRTNPHMMLVGLPGMGKTTTLINICRQLSEAGISPIVFSYHDDIDEKLSQVIGAIDTVDFDGLGFNPLTVDAQGSTAHIDVAGTLRDIFSSIFPDLGDLQLEELRQAIKQSYDDLGWSSRAAGASPPPTPPFRAFLDILKAKPKPNANLLARLQELDDYRFFDGSGSAGGLIGSSRPKLVRVHGSTNGILQNAFAAFVLYSLYKDMFRRGVQSRITHAIVFDEAHRAAKLKLVPRFAKECRKYGISLVLASQGARDFDSSLFEAVGSYLVLRVTEGDARSLARNTGSTADQSRTSDRLKSLEPYSALLFSSASVRPVFARLDA